jgi:hypothetical protein
MHDRRSRVGRPAGHPREGRLLLLRFWVLSTAPSSNVPKQNEIVNLFVFFILGAK